MSQDNKSLSLSAVSFGLRDNDTRFVLEVKDIPNQIMSPLLFGFLMAVEGIELFIMKECAHRFPGKSFLEILEEYKKDAGIQERTVGFGQGSEAQCRKEMEETSKREGIPLST